MKEKKYRKFEIFKKEYREPSTDMNIKKSGNDFNVIMPKTKETLELKVGKDIIMYQKFSGNVRGYDVILVGGVKKSDSYTEQNKQYIDVETIDDERIKKEITDLLIDSKKSEKEQEIVCFHDMEYHGK